jgi:hypothetical protein
VSDLDRAPAPVGLAQRQLATIAWNGLRVEGGSAEEVPSDLHELLFVDDERSEEAYWRLINSVVCQGSLFSSAPAVVSVIAAALADGAVPARNLRQSLDVVGRLVGGRADGSEVAAGNKNLQHDCLLEALKAYWPLVRVALTPDPYGASDLATELLGLLDGEHSRRLLRTAQARPLGPPRAGS